MKTNQSMQVVNNNITDSKQEKSPYGNYIWIIISCAWIFYLYEYILRVSPSVIDKQLMIDYKTTATMLGTISGAYYWSYVPLQVPCGVIADRLGARRVIVLSSLLCILGCILFAQSTIIDTAILGRILMGAGSACAYICCTKVAAEWFTPNRFALLAGITMFMGTLGGSLNTVFALIVEWVEWRLAIMIFAGIGVFIAAMAWFLMKDKNDKTLKTIPEDENNIIDGLMTVIKNPQNWLVGLYGCAMYLPLSAFAELWGVPYLTQIYGVSAKIASRACIPVFIGMGMGCIISAWISNLLKSRKKVMSWSAVGTLACFLVVFFMPTIPFELMCIMLFLGGLLSGGQILYFAVAKENTPLRYSATVVGFTNALVMCSAMIFQPLLGKILDLTWQGTLTEDGMRLYTIENYQTAFIALAFAFVAGWVLMLFVRETFNKTAEQ